MIEQIARIHIDSQAEIFCELREDWTSKSAIDIIRLKIIDYQSGKYTLISHPQLKPDSYQCFADSLRSNIFSEVRLDLITKVGTIGHCEFSQNYTDLVTLCSFISFQDDMSIDSTTKLYKEIGAVQHLEYTSSQRVDTRYSYYLESVSRKKLDISPLSGPDQVANYLLLT